MTEHKECKECQWNKYPLCEGTVMPTGKFMNIEYLTVGFNCGKKFTDHSIKVKSDLELRVEKLEKDIKELKK